MSENNEPEFTKGMFVKTPDRYKELPSFIKAKLAIRREEFIEWLEGKPGDEWVNIDIKVSRKGKWYAQVDNWKPEYTLGPKENFDEDIPF